MKNLAHIRQGLLWAAIAALFSFLFIKIQGVNYAAHDNTLTLIRNIEYLDTRLNEDILKSNLGLLHNYDPLVDTTRKTRRLSQRLQTASSAIPTDKRQPADEAFNIAAQTSSEKMAAIEHFKMQNTQLQSAADHLQSAMRYFVEGDSDLDSLLNEAEYSRLKTAISGLLLDTLLYLEDDSAVHGRPRVEAQLQNLHALRGQYPAAVNEAVRVTLVYVANAIQLKPVVDNLVREMIAMPTAKHYQALYTTHQAYYDVAEKEAAVYRLLLYVSSILLLVYVGYILFRLRQSSRTLEETYRDLEFQKAALDHHAIVSITDANGNIIYANEKFREISQYSEQDLLGANHRIVNSGLHTKDFFADLWKTISSGKVWQGHVRNRKRDGSFYWVATTIVPFMDHTGRPSRYVSIRTDITRQKETEEELRRNNDELEERVRVRTADLEATNAQAELYLDQLQQRDEENNMLVYSVSHDLRSPLVNLQGFSNELTIVSQDLRLLMASDNIPEDIRKRGLALLDSDMQDSINFIRAGVMRLSNIIDALLRLSRAGQVEYHWTGVKMGSVIQRITDSMQSIAQERGATFTTTDLPPLWGDATAIEQIFANLLGNALNYLDPNRPGLIEIGWIPENSVNATLRTYYVRDNGLGMSVAAQGKLFQIFQRFHPDKAKGEGVGLSIVRRMVERHGGKIWVQSCEGEGTTFFISLPVNTMDTEAAA
ncbi:MAG: ATP-binding protein [Gammaproteobacteria bacterium]|nr:ATP-binding protein [Gammaproteobacteria bacterium]